MDTNFDYMEGPVISLSFIKESFHVRKCVMTPGKCITIYFLVEGSLNESTDQINNDQLGTSNIRKKLLINLCNFKRYLRFEDETG